VRSASPKKPVALKAASRPARRGLRTKTTPAALEDLIAAIDRLAPQSPFAIGVSGGSDSLSLMHGGAAWARARGAAPPVVLTVDHRLRRESATEAKKVRQWATATGLEHEILVWGGQKPKTRVAADARSARYRLLGEWCVAHGVRSLLVAHTRDDVAETMVMRLTRGSGLDGLAAMNERLVIEIEEGQVELLRPFLAISRAELQRFLEDMGQAWIDDPSNADEHYERVRIRRLLEKLQSIGLDAEHLARSARRLSQVRETLETLEDQAFEASVRLHPEGFATLRLDAFRTLKPELQRRVLGAVTSAVAPQDYRPDENSLDRLRVDFDDFRGATLGGCQFIGASEGVLVVRELNALKTMSRSLRPGETSFWDRFRVSLPGTAGVLPTLKGRQDAGSPREEWVVRALGRDGAKAVAGEDAAAKRRLEAYPAAAKWTFPALYLDGTPVAVPHVGYVDRAYGPLAQGFLATFLGRRSRRSMLSLLTET
jgi:tRNA(Ile)-lysidine synthase